MAYLCISKNRSSSDVILLQEGEVFEIDKYTTKFLDSEALRKRNKKQTKEYNETYPEGKRGGIRLFVPTGDELIEYPVLYKKHVIAFREIIKNYQFMAHYSEIKRNQEYYAYKERTGNNRGNHETDLLTRIMKQKNPTSVSEYIRYLKWLDENNCKVKGGGRRYYEFIRGIIHNYNKYLETHPTLPDVDHIAETHFKRLGNAKLEKRNHQIKESMQNPTFEFVDNEMVLGGFVENDEESTKTR